MQNKQPLMDCSVDISSRLASDKEINKKPKCRISKEVTYITVLAGLIFFTGKAFVLFHIVKLTLKIDDIAYSSYLFLLHKSVTNQLS